MPEVEIGLNQLTLFVSLCPRLRSCEHGQERKEQDAYNGNYALGHVAAYNCRGWQPF